MARPNSICSLCQTPFYASPIRITSGEALHCSRACRNAAMKKPPTICAECGLAFSSRHANPRYCSLLCTNRARRRNRPLIPFEQRFWSKVNQAGPIPPHRPELGRCWVWTISLSMGYGYIEAEDRKIGSHVASWRLHVGLVPKDMYVLHACDNRACVNPSHLFLGTQRDNVHDMISKGRQDFTHLHNNHID